MGIKMKAMFRVSAFVGPNLLGNPAAVCLSQDLKDTATCQAIAAENQLPVTAFICEAGDKFSIRWFTPLSELPLCGHGTLAASHVIYEQKKMLLPVHPIVLWFLTGQAS